MLIEDDNALNAEGREALFMTQLPELWLVSPDNEPSFACSEDFINSQDRDYFEACLKQRLVMKESRVREMAFPTKRPRAPEIPVGPRPSP